MNNELLLYNYCGENRIFNNGSGDYLSHDDNPLGVINMVGDIENQCEIDAGEISSQTASKS